MCPTALDFRPEGDSGCYLSEGTWCQVLVVRPNLAAQLSDRSISDISDLPVPMVVTWHLAQVDKVRAKEILSDKTSSNTDIRLAEARLKRSLIRQSVAAYKPK